MTYLESRGFDDPRRLVTYYGLRYAITGPDQQRLLFPIRDSKKVLRGWVGRAIGKTSLRYRVYPSGEGLRPYVWNEDLAAEGGRLLVIVEGPFDALKVDWYSRHDGVRSVPLLGKGCPPARLVTVRRLVKQFDDAVLLLDADAVADSLRLSRLLQVRVAVLESGDPGGLSAGEVSDRVNAITRYPPRG